MFYTLSSFTINVCVKVFFYININPIWDILANKSTCKIKIIKINLSIDNNDKVSESSAHKGFIVDLI